jgi:hypothetical protein
LSIFQYIKKLSSLTAQLVSLFQLLYLLLGCTVPATSRATPTISSYVDGGQRVLRVVKQPTSSHFVSLNFLDIVPSARLLLFAHIPQGKANMSSEGAAGQFQVLEELGSGSFGVVYKAIERSTGEIVAIKHVRFTSPYA